MTDQEDVKPVDLEDTEATLWKARKGIDTQEARWRLYYTTVPALVAEVRRLREEVRKAKEKAALWETTSECYFVVHESVLRILGEPLGSDPEAAAMRVVAERDQLRACKSCEPTWTPTGVMDSAPCRKCGRIIDLRIFQEMQEQNVALLRGNAKLAADVHKKADERDQLRAALEVAGRVVEMLAGMSIHDDRTGDRERVERDVLLGEWEALALPSYTSDESTCWHCHSIDCICPDPPSSDREPRHVPACNLLVNVDASVGVTNDRGCDCGALPPDDREPGGEK